jgi:hypothetical protein
MSETLTTEPAVQFILKPYNIKELIDMYKISYKTWRTWIAPHVATIGEKRGRYYTVNQVKTIVTILGYPDTALGI